MARRRLVVVLVGRMQPRWLLDLLDRLADGNALTRIVVPTEPPRGSPLAPLAAAVDRDRTRNAEHRAAIDRVAIDPDRPGASLRVRDAITGEDIPSDTDVVLWIGPDAPPTAVVGRASQGVWQLRVHAGPGPEAAGFWEPLLGRSMTAVSIHGHHRDAARAGVVADARIRTDRYSPSSNQLRFAATVEELLLRSLRSKSEPASPGAGPAAPDPTADAAAGPAAPGWPGPTLVAGAARIAWARLRDRVRRRMGEERWILGYRYGEPTPADPGAGGFVRLRPPAGTFWADPFAVFHGGRHYVFFEEYVRDRGRGRISAFELGPDGPGPSRVVLDTGRHLSYPFLFRFGDALHMLPESLDAGATTLYRCDQFPDRWAPVAEILPGRRLVDPTILHHRGRWWLFAGHGGPADCEQLLLFHADAPTGPWTEHPASPVVRTPDGARPAGRVFEWAGTLYRPGQSCVPRYGTAVLVHRIDRLDLEGYRETVVGRLGGWGPGIEGCHTLTFDRGLTVVDGRLSPFYPGRR